MRLIRSWAYDDMDAVLGDVDRRAIRMAVKTARRLCSLWTSSSDPDDSLIVDDVAAFIEDAMIEAHSRASYLYGLEIVASSRTIRRILKKATKSEKKALSELYGAVARSATKKAMSRVRDVLVTNVVFIGTKAQRREAVRKALSSVGALKAADHVVATLTRTQTSLAFNAAAWEATVDRDDVWGFEYVTKRDERVREDHKVLDGIRYPKDHSFWRIYAPPNGWNCRCVLKPLRRGRIRAPRRKPSIDIAFRLNPGVLAGIANI